MCTVNHNITKFILDCQQNAVGLESKQRKISKTKRRKEKRNLANTKKATKMDCREQTKELISNENCFLLAPKVSINEFYFNLNLGNIERIAEEFKSAVISRSSENHATLLDSENIFKSKADEEDDEKHAITRELKKLKTPVSRQPSKQLSENSRSENDALKHSVDDTTVLLEQLKLLQMGKVTSVQNQQTNPLPKPKIATNKEEEIKRNRVEVQRLNFQIQQKISRQIQPKLNQILNRRDTSLASKHESTRETNDHLSEQIPRKKIQKQTRSVPIAKTIVDKEHESVEIYRYSQDDLNQLQSSATLQIIPRLKELKICSSEVQISEVDVLLLKLLNTDDEQLRQSIILQAAESRKLIKRQGNDDFKFRSVLSEINEEEDMSNQKPDLNEIERLITLAKNDDELNELVYKREFIELFMDPLITQKICMQDLPTVVQHLIETNQAQIVEGEIRVNSRNNQEAYVSQQNGAKDVCIKKLILRQHAFQGDIVKVLVKTTTEGQDVSLELSQTEGDLDSSITLEANKNFGCVLEILEKRHSRRVVGSLGVKKLKKNILLSARDTRVPNVRIKCDENFKDLYSKITDNALVLAEITSWKLDQPIGRVVQVIGEKGQLKVENEAILLQHNLDPQPFTQSIIDQLPTEPFTIPSEEFEYRQDLRKKCIFSIDPETARDLDDALSCEILPNGNLSVGVHISDVSFFLKEKSQLDEIVAERATSIYLVDTVYHMLPEKLCLLCSLLPEADKLAYSVFWEMNRDTAEIISTHFTRSVLNSCAKLSYEHAQMVIETDDHDWDKLAAQFPKIYNGFQIQDVAHVIVQLQRLAVIMKRNRKCKGAIKIDQPKISFKFDKADLRMEAPVDFFQYKQKDSNCLIEEFMLLANISVANFIHTKFPKISLLRNHPPPNEVGLKKLVATLLKHGIKFDISSSSAISASMERLIERTEDKAGKNAVINLMVSKTMSRARYFCTDIAKEDKDFYHYALSIDQYTHFTSPIRRYADILVHR